MMKYLQKLGKSLMLPVACLPICGILMGIGYALCPATMQGGEMHGFLNLLGFFLVKAGGALIDNMALLFVIGVGVGMADDHDGTAGLAAFASWLMMTNLLATGTVTTLMPSIADNVNKTLAFSKIANPFIGILAGIIGATCYNKFKNTKLPDVLRQALCSDYFRRGIYRCGSNPVVCMADNLRCTDCSWSGCRRYGSSRCRYLCVPEQTVDPYRSASCIE